MNGKPANVARNALVSVQRWNDQNGNSGVFGFDCAILYGGLEDMAGIEVATRNQTMFGEEPTAARGGNKNGARDLSIRIDSGNRLEIQSNRSCYFE